MLVADEFVNYSICGLPFLVSGEVDDWHSLAHRDAREIIGRDIDVRLRHRVTAIDLERRQVSVATDPVQRISWDLLILATGARPVLPAIPGIDLEGVFALHTMADGIRLRRWVDERRPRTAAVVGAGYIGVEVADALARRGVQVLLVGRAASVLPTVHPDLGLILETELRRNGVDVITGAAVGRIDRSESALAVTLDRGYARLVDLVVVGAGVVPDAEVARTAGLGLGVQGAIRVNRRMETSEPNVLAAGVCVETWHAVEERATYLPLGTTAHKQGRVAGSVAAAADAMFGGSVGTQVVKVFDLAAARTGLSETEAAAAGFEPFATSIQVPDHKRYYPGATNLTIRVIGDVTSHRLLGAQIIGHWQAEVAKRIDVFAAALHQRLTVEALSDLDLSYTPPLGAPWDPVQAAAQKWEQAVKAA